MGALRRLCVVTAVVMGVCDGCCGFTKYDVRREVGLGGLGGMRVEGR